jgi:hypothetical protein
MSRPLAGSDDEVSICSTSSEFSDTSDSGDSSDEHCDSDERSFPDDNSDVSGEDTDTTGELVRHDGLDFLWPAADTFTDDTFGCPELTTCSELGSQRIRLLRIQSGPSSSLIRLDTKVCFLYHAGQYTALSYTWGSPVLQREVIINDEPRAITTNLWRFLSQARKLPARYSGWLWIDALSIDQSDLCEKAEQVKIISNIFACAKQAVLWLGPAYGDSDRAMKALATLSTSGTTWKSPRSLWAAPLGPAILGLCKRAYWQRLWVLQELKASHRIDLMCGDREVKFERLRAFLLAENVDERTQEQVRTLKRSSATMMVALTIESFDSSLRSMLDATSHLRHTNPLDRVYAILNVVSTGREGIEADYTATFTELINSVLRGIMEQGTPSNLRDVFMECDFLESLFAVESGSMFKLEGATSTNLCRLSPNRLGRLADPALPPETYYNIEPIEPTAMSLHMWCKRYDHKKIRKMIQRSLEEQMQELRSYAFATAKYNSVREDMTAAIGLFDLL